MRRISGIFFAVLLLLAALTGCSPSQKVKIGVAFGVGPAARWPQEQRYMEDHAAQRNIGLEVRFNTDEQAKPLAQDCTELIDSGIDVLIVRPRNVYDMASVVGYAHEKGVLVISYDSMIEQAPIDFFVGYDGEHTGRILGRYLTELVPAGDYILLWGDMNRNVEDMYRGAMRYLEPLGADIRILLADGVKGWSAEEGKRVVKQAIADNGGQIDAIFAFNDTLAGACIQALEELEIARPVAVAGMDAQLDAVRRVVAGTQSCTAYMDLKKLACTTIDLAVDMAEGEQVQSNAIVDNDSGSDVPAYLLSRELVTDMNVDRTLIESGYYTREQIYGS